MDQSHHFDMGSATPVRGGRLTSRRLRRRARLDSLLVVAATLASTGLGATAAESMMAAMATLSLGILAYVIRRDRDLSRFAASERSRHAAIRGKGLSMGEWRAGIPLQPWPRRESSADTDQV